MALTTRRWTVEEVEALPEKHPGDRHELIDGELFVSPVPIIKHQDCSENIAFALQRHVRRNRLGRVYTAPTGVRLHHDTLVIPDICFVARSRLHMIGAKTIDGAPDLIVEILSPGTRQRDLSTKRALYARFGVAEYWIVDPNAKTVLVLALANDRYDSVPLGEHGSVVSRVLAELRLSLDEVFADNP
jgi:Uma2 family endonuclease